MADLAIAKTMTVPSGLSSKILITNTILPPLCDICEISGRYMNQYSLYLKENENRKYRIWTAAVVSCPDGGRH